MKKVILAFIAGLVTSLSLAQEGLPTFSQYLVGDSYLLNPSYAGVDPEIFKFTAAIQNQWADLPESPKTQTVSMHATVVDRLAFGAYFFHDKNGLTTNSGVNISAAYHIPINARRDYRFDEAEDRFSFGLSYHVFTQKLDLNKVIVTDPNDPLLRDPKYTLNRFNVGTSFKYGDAYGGVSVLDIPLADNEAIANGIEPIPTQYFLQLGYHIYLSEGIYLDPSFLMDLKSNSERRFDLNLVSHFSFGDRNQGVDVGVSYRSDSDKNGSQGLTISPLMKLKVGDLRLGFSYNIGLSDIAKEGGNGILFSLGYDFGNPFSPDFR